jgi:hypothetical protein
VQPALGYAAPNHDRASSEEMWRWVLAFLDRIDTPESDVEGEIR